MNQDSVLVCIASAPGNTDATCKQFSKQLHDRAGTAAMDICTRVHGVQCVPVDCQDNCVNTATLDVTSDVLLVKNSLDCPANQNGCKLGNTIWDCTCDCQVQL